MSEKAYFRRAQKRRCHPKVEIACMGWYNRAETTLSQTEYKRLRKIAVDEVNLGGDDAAAAINQHGTYISMYDVQRYVMDSYNCKVTLSKTSRCITVTLLISHAFLGTIAWDAYWTYSPDEMEMAEDMHKVICKVIKDVCEEFTEDHTTTAIFWPTIRSRIELVQPGKMVATNIPFINYARDIPIEPDWRSNIYGNRYPRYDEISYDQQAMKANRWVSA